MVFSAGSAPGVRLPASGGCSLRRKPRLGEEDAGLPGVERGAGAGWTAEEAAASPAVVAPPAAAPERQRGSAAGQSMGSGSASSSTLRTLRSCFRLQSARDSLRLPLPPPDSLGRSPPKPLLTGFGLPAAAAAPGGAEGAAAVAAS